MPVTVWRKFRPGWVGRGVFFGIATVLHLGLGMSLMLMHPPDSMRPRIEVPGRLEVRLIDIPDRSSVTVVQPRPTSMKPLGESARRGSSSCPRKSMRKNTLCARDWIDVSAATIHRVRSFRNLIAARSYAF